MKDDNLTAIFSGRFDPPHLAHLHTILRIAKKYGRVVVIILDYSDRMLPALKAAEIFNTMFDAILSPISKSKIEVIVNDIHFANITFSQYDLLLRNNGICYSHSVYLSGNKEVLDNFKRQQIRNEYCPRTDDYIYTGTIIREQVKNGKSISDFMPKENDV